MKKLLHKDNSIIYAHNKKKHHKKYVIVDRFEEALHE